MPTNPFSSKSRDEPVLGLGISFRHLASIAFAVVSNLIASSTDLVHAAANLPTQRLIPSVASRD
jgi:hypothetical protein